ncbi:MAG: Nucleotide sugar dehydrogenase, partial [Proteiniphilum acetatigenes]
MKIAVVGTGYVGLVSGACFAEMGVDVTCVDIDQQKIESLKKGIIPIYEPGLNRIVERNSEAERLHFTTDLPSVLNEMDIVFIAVGTPSDEKGNADLSQVMKVAETIADHMTHPLLIVTKSTVPVGTSYRIRDLVRQRLDKRGLTELSFDVASNPEFLKEGAAINDFMSPDRVVVGVESEEAKELMSKLYRPFMLNNFRVIFMDILSSEMTKYASNAMLATRISFMNDIANLCERVGADVNMVRRGMGSDSRIGRSFLYPGCGYGGSCFPKDIRALISVAEGVGYEMKLLKAVEEVNNQQKNILFEKLKNHFDGKLDGMTVSIWGLSFKPETDDVRDAPSLTL